MRECREELGLDLTPDRLLVVDWVPTRDGRTDRVMVIYDGHPRPRYGGTDRGAAWRVAGLGLVGPATGRRASCSSLTTGPRPALRMPTSATKRASVGSVLRPCPVANTRVLADSFGGTSATCSPSASSRRSRRRRVVQARGNAMRLRRARRRQKWASAGGRFRSRSR
ncbi:hypothetical protein ACGF3C_19840 [Micromonospora sp. NPDC047762]|uniref:hypothetical protein n=1 Tax=Micromonospora sp. NPDC047762 TaxID=3364255 RepID=UPI0037184BDF